MGDKELECRAEVVKSSNHCASDPENYDPLPAEELEAITLRNAQTSPLLRLPTELRNKIYAYVLGGKALEFGMRIFRDTKYMHDNSATTAKHHLNILETCRQIHKETANMPFQLNSMLQCIYPFGEDHFEKITYAQRAAIERVQLRLRWRKALVFDRWYCQQDDFAFLDRLPGLRSVSVDVVDLFADGRRRRWDEVRVPHTWHKVPTILDEEELREFLAKALEKVQRNGVSISIRIMKHSPS